MHILLIHLVCILTMTEHFLNSRKLYGNLMNYLQIF